MKCDFKEHPRKAYGQMLTELGDVNPNIVVLDADLSCSTQTQIFAKKYPGRFFNVGVAEQNLMGISAGLALGGKTVFTSAFAMFGTGRSWEQVRNTICYDKLNVKLVLTHAGITVGKDGASHQALEDISLMRSIPNMRVMVPADSNQTRAMVRFAAEYDGPVYIRLTREAMPQIFDDLSVDCVKPNILFEGSDVSIFACGLMVAESIKALAELKKKGISAALINMHTIKPLDAKTVISEAKKTGAIVTVEEHSIIGGLGSAVAEVLSENHPTPLQRVGTQDLFGKSGDAPDLMKQYHLTPEDIVKAAEKVVKRK